MRSISLTALLVVAAALTTTTSAIAQKQTAAPKKTTAAPAAARPEPQGAMPELVIAVAKGRDKVELRRVVTRIVAEVSEFKTASGDTIPQTQMRPMPETHSSVVDLSTFTFRRVDGKPVSKNDLANRLAKATPILIMEPGTKYDDRLLGVYKPDTLIFLEKTPRRISPNASPEIAPTSAAVQGAPAGASPDLVAPAVPEAPSATPASVVPRRK